MECTKEQISEAQAHTKDWSLEKLERGLAETSAHVLKVLDDSERESETLALVDVDRDVLPGVDDEERIKKLGEMVAQTRVMSEKIKARRSVTNLRKEMEAGEKHQETQAEPAPAAALGLSNNIMDSKRYFASMLDKNISTVNELGRPIRSDVPIVLDERAFDGFRNTLMTTSAGFPPESLRSGQVVLSAQRPIQVIDLLPSRSTSQNATKYVEETTFTNAAAAVAEGAAIPEASLQYTERTEPIVKVGVTIPATEEELADNPGIQMLLEGRLGFMVRQTVDNMLINGTGSNNQTTGFLSKTGTGSTVTDTAKRLSDLYRACVKVQLAGRAMPGGYILHPTDFANIRLTTSSEGVYLYGMPSEMLPTMVWGKPVAESDSLALGTAITGDFMNFSRINWRRDINLSLTDSHDVEFTKDIWRWKITVRFNLEILRPAAFVKITGLNTAPS